MFCFSATNSNQVKHSVVIGLERRPGIACLSRYIFCVIKNDYITWLCLFEESVGKSGRSFLMQQQQTGGPKKCNCAAKMWIRDGSVNGINMLIVWQLKNKT